jgi:sterol desaturase/sphingolipid hydroxylase (fatty acid hydroxylase superfamily)
MEKLLIHHGGLLIYFSYALIFTLLILLEIWIPRRPAVYSRLKRWPHNLAIFAIGGVLDRGLNTVAFANLAYIAWKNHWGLLNQFDLSPWVSLGLSLLILDLSAYAVHFCYHKISYTWLFHRVHHSDPDLDVTTGERLHPIENLVSFFLQQGFILLAGPSLLGVIGYNLLVSFLSPFSHANIRVWPPLEKILRLFVITPDWHRVHHSMVWAESNANFGFVFPWWDYLFRTYIAQPSVPHEKMDLGLKEFRSPRFLNLGSLLAFPFLKKGD